MGGTPSEFYYNSDVAFLHFRLKQDRGRAAGAAVEVQARAHRREIRQARLVLAEVGPDRPGRRRADQRRDPGRDGGDLRLDAVAAITEEAEVDRVIQWPLL